MRTPDQFSSADAEEVNQVATAEVRTTPQGVKLSYDPTHSLSYGYHGCSCCGSTFYGGGEALHNKGCGETGYAKTVYFFGPKQVETLKEMASKHGDEVDWYGINMKVLKEVYPELI